MNHFILGVAVKTYMAGPTHCTKLKVYRPKTCGVVPKPLDKSKYNDRPHTSGGKAKMGPMGKFKFNFCLIFRA